MIQPGFLLKLQNTDINFAFLSSQIESVLPLSVRLKGIEKKFVRSFFTENLT